MRPVLDKSPAVLAVVDLLWSRLGSDGFVIADHWKDELGAVGIASPRDPRVLVYISSGSETPECFDFELELPPLPGIDFPYQVAGSGTGLAAEELIDVVARHLRHAS